VPSRRLYVCAPIVLAALGACREAPPRLGATPSEAQHNVGEALGALASCFGPIEREPAYEALRPRLLHAALVPSRVFDDESAWLSRDGETRGLGFSGFRAHGRYRLGVRADPPPPTRVADYRGWLSLRRLGPGEFEWSSAEEIGLGPLPVEGLADGIGEVLHAVESSDEGDARPELRRLLRRTADTLGRGLALDAVHLERDSTGAMAVSAAAHLDLDSLERVFPHYASFLRRYVVPIAFRLEFGDGAGRLFWTTDVREGRATLRARIQNGHLVSLEGAPLGVPERLRLRIDLTSRAGLFRYGLDRLQADVRLVARPSEKRLDAVFVREPDWVIPFLVKPFLRASLRRPFEGEGAFLGYAIRENGEGMTLVSRDYRLAVKESWLVRWFGGNAGEAVGSFREGAEAEADRFTGETLLALRADFVRLMGTRATQG
jgi:hypothetical protein